MHSFALYSSMQFIHWFIPCPSFGCLNLFACRADRVGNEHSSRHPCDDGRNTGAGPEPVAPSRLHRNECKPSPRPRLGNSIGSLSGRGCRGRRIFRPIFCTVALRTGEAFFFYSRWVEANIIVLGSVVVFSLRICQPYERPPYRCSR